MDDDRILDWDDEIGISKRQEEYQEYLQSLYWKWISGKRKEIDNYKCQFCGEQENKERTNLVVHHNSYNLYNEDINELITLCRDCHDKLHKLVYNPQNGKMTEAQLNTQIMRDEYERECKQFIEETAKKYVRKESEYAGTIAYEFLKDKHTKHNPATLVRYIRHGLGTGLSLIKYCPDIAVKSHEITCQKLSELRGKRKKRVDK